MKEKRDYYESDGLEVFDVIEAFDLNFNLGNVMKYICRAGRKTFDPIPDLRKACTYLEREIERLEADPIMNNDESDPITNNDEKLKALMDSEIDGLCIRYNLSDASKRSIKKICEFGKKGLNPVAMDIHFGLPDSAKQSEIERLEEDSYDD